MQSAKLIIDVADLIITSRRYDSPEEITPDPIWTRDDYDDERFVGALTDDWQTVAQLAERMLAAGRPASFDLITRRMAEYVRETTLIERQHATYRLTPTIVPPPVSPRSVTLHRADCLNILPVLPDASVDLFLCDLPYQVTQHRSDIKIDLDALFAQLRRIVTPTGNILMFATMRFAQRLIDAAPDLFRYDMVWVKNKSTHFQHAKNRPLCPHELILVFSHGVTNANSLPCIKRPRMTYNPQGVVSLGKKQKKARDIAYLGKQDMFRDSGTYDSHTGYPTTMLHFAKDGSRGAHPFAKPVDLLNYLIRTYSDDGATVCDPTMGSGSTGVAAVQTDRQFIGIERYATSFHCAEIRIAEANKVDRRQT